ncbi:cobyrinate a,c-diamide synthase [Intrasporangium calvum]|uniref:cobyrinate a,c-diamide synthase n=1 Tax=Intrasporangium calvum TaxID=53358 RepID=UPI000DF5F9C4|nr:cobyrinate a,c-diamide synthase [Intrasporangium calvum]AXG15229.1 cobyrinate a,c-diamide synthase [Intrasporangium calvum]
MTTGPAPTVLPRFVVAAPASGHGKTTVATGIMAALVREGLDVTGFKVGPDYIDPGFHALATGRPGRNLDPFLCGEDLVEPLLLHGARASGPTDVAVVEGVMGLFDGQIDGAGFASTAHVAALTHSPVVLVLDVSHLSRTAGAIVHGLTTFEPGTHIGGVVLNKASSERHVREVRAAVESTGVPVLGVIPRDAGVGAPSRHLGLVPAEELDGSAGLVAHLAQRVSEHVDLPAVLRIAHGAPPLTGAPWDPAAALGRPPVPGPRPVVAVAGGRAFTFRYAETEELLYAAGLAPVPFDPLRSPALPDGTAGLYLGGGFPEVHAAELSGNAGLRDAVRAAVAAGLPTVAECAGLLYLCESVDGHPMVGAVPGRAAMGPSLILGYRNAVAPSSSLLGAAGTRVTGHEFHRTTVAWATGRTDAVASADPAWLLDGRSDGIALDPAGTGTPTVHASYLHTHWAGHPGLASRFADAVHAFAAAPTPSSAHLVPSSAKPPTPSSAHFVPSSAAPSQCLGDADGHDLLHHGDRDVQRGLVDLAVNVRRAAPPAWLADVIAGTIDGLGTYPDTRQARQALAARHGVDPSCVLPTSGGAEAFTLVARGIATRQALVVHPQFTEPEAALRAAGHAVGRHVLTADHGFRLDPAAVPAQPDLVVVGNPTNPTGVLHPAEALRALRGDGRVLVVDEAFMDAVPGEPESLLQPGADLRGVLVLRSLTKTWGLAGLRAGYVVGDPALVARLAAVQPPWSVSTPALAAMVACSSPAAVAEADRAAGLITGDRAILVDLLTETGLTAVPDSAAPFVLVDTSDLGPGSIREHLAARGFAVRRGETFPGLGPTWIRVAVRTPDVSAALAGALTDLRRSLRAS